jgi:hypothetical protein
MLFTPMIATAQSEYAPETLNLFEDFSNLADYSSLQKYNIDQYVRSLVTGGVWAKLIRLTILVTPSLNEVDYLSNWKPSPPALPLTVHPFGFSGYSANQGIQASTTPLAGVHRQNINLLGQFGSAATHPGLLSDFSFGIWSLTDSQSTGGDVGLLELQSGNPIGWSLRIRNGSDSLECYINSQTAITATNTNSKGFYLADRDSSDVLIARNDSTLATVNSTAASYGSDPALTGIVYDYPPLGAIERDTGSGKVLEIANRAYAMAFIGRHLSTSERTVFFEATRDYLLTYLSAATLGV